MPLSYSFSIASRPVSQVSLNGAAPVIRGDLHLPLATERKAGGSPLPLVIFCHGFKGFKDWGFIPFLAESIAAKGAAVARFNYSLNGIGDDFESFTELDRFKANTLAQEGADLLEVIRSFRSGVLPLPGSVDRSAIVLMGHSRGGVAVLRCAGTAPERDLVKRIVLLASVSRYPEVSPEERKEWRASGVRYVENTRTGQQLPCGLGLLDEIERGEGEIERFARAVTAPALIIHGDNDTSVPVESATRLASWIPTNTVYILPGADHAFGATHPFKGPTPHLTQLLTLL